MNEKASVISTHYIETFRSGFNQYMQLTDARPYDSLEKYRQLLWRLGMLVEMWALIEIQQKERKNG